MRHDSGMLTASCLAGTRYADVDHPEVARAVTPLLRRAPSQRDVAVSLFRFVRDEVRYTFGPWGVAASVTLTSREGTCTNKNNLLVTLLRAAGIPAAYGVLRVTAREYFGVIAPPCFKPLVSDESIHIYAAAHIGGRWIRCDCSTDAEIAAKTSHFCEQTRLVDWDGACDALDALDPVHIHADLGLRPSIDDLLTRPPVNAKPAVLDRLNDFVSFIRSQPLFASAGALHAAYFAARENHQ